MEINNYYRRRDKAVSLLREIFYYIDSYQLHTIINSICKNLSLNNRLYFKTVEHILSIENRILSCIDGVEKNKNDDKKTYKENLKGIVFEIENIFRFENKDESPALNTIDFYSTTISELEKKEKELRDEVSDLKKKNQKYAEKEKEIENIKKQIQQSIEEKNILQKELDARDNMSIRISDAFTELKKHTEPLKNEKTRLNWMFGIFASLCVGVLGLLIYFECTYLSQWSGAQKWIDYLPYYIPIPIVGGLLWLFIYQMNRAQRQLMQLANVLYHIDYVEGLLLAINYVNVDMNIAIDKINRVLDQLVKNYMHTPNSLSEQSIDKELSKDNIDLHAFVNIAKEIKEIIK